MIGRIIVDGKSSADFGVYLTDAGSYSVAERDVDSVKVQGRDGELIIDNGRYKNASLTYPAVIAEDFNYNYTAFMGYIHSRRGYMRVEDSFHPDEYVLARYVGETTPKTVKGNKGTFVLKFSRKPQRYLKSGESALTFTNTQGGVSPIYNELYTDAKPLVRVYGTGDVSIGTETITISSSYSYSYMDIDCDSENAYYGTINVNDKITLGSGNFWTLKPGLNSITLGNGITRIEVTPRWWRL